MFREDVDTSHISKSKINHLERGAVESIPPGSGGRGGITLVDFAQLASLALAIIETAVKTKSSCCEEFTTCTI